MPRPVFKTDGKPDQFGPLLTVGPCRLYHGHVLDVLRRLPAASVQAYVTSPPYWGLRDYGTGSPDEIGREPTPDGFVANMVAVFREVRRVLRDDGVLWLNLGDSYTSGGRVGHGTRVGYKQQTNRGMNGRNDPERVDAGLRDGNLVGIPWRVALALQADGWVLRADVPWVKRSAMPESVRNRPAKALEYWFMLVKRSGYYFDMEAVRKQGSSTSGGWQSRAARGEVVHGNGETAQDVVGIPVPGTRSFRNADLWFQSVTAPHGLTGVGDELVGLDVTAGGYAVAHFATFPPALVEPLIRCVSREDDVVLDPFCGSGTVGAVCVRLGRRFVGIDLNERYLREHAAKRIGEALLVTRGPAELAAPKPKAVRM